MNEQTVIALLTGIVLLTTPFSAGIADAGHADSARTRYIVGFDPLPRDLQPGDTYQGAPVLKVNTAIHFAVVQPRDASSFMADAHQDDNVQYIEEDRVLQWVRYTPNDPRFDDQYGPQQVRAPEAWDTTLGDTSKSVCVVDTGVRYTHEDLEGSRWLGGHDYVNNDDDPWDDNGHGTHVAGSAAASIDNALGIAGVANVGLYGVKVLDSGGSGSFSDVADGITWCTDNGADVISLSLGGGSGTTALRLAVEDAWDRGRLVVAAAGNNGPCTDCVDYPGKYDDAMAITCTTASESLCSFSSQGPEAELAAPGNSILSTCFNSDTSYCSKSGTSMSTPHVSGVAALVWSHVGDLTNQQLRDLLHDNAKDLGEPGWDEEFGHGLVDAKATLDAADDPGEPPAQETVFFEDFDDGSAPGWTLDGLWHVTDSCETPPSSPNYLGYHRETACDYDTGSRTSGEARFDVDLTDATVATLLFEHFFEVESFSGEYDVMRVEVSTDGGSNWDLIDQWDARDETNNAWSPESFALDSYTGGTLDIRFFFDSMDGQFNAQPGWHVDDVEVTADGDGGDPPANEPPVADAGADQSVNDDDGSGSEDVTLDGSGSSDPDGSIASWEWFDEADELIATGETPTVGFAVGEHLVTLEVTDDDGATDTDTTTVSVLENQSPTATFTHDCSGLTCDFDGTGSSDPDGEIVEYDWDFGDGNTDTGATPSHTYAEEGTYTVTLTVTDNGGATDTHDDDVSVSEPSGPDVVYAEDFDGGSADGWHKSGGDNDLWRVASDCVDPHVGSHQLAFSRQSPDCDYDVGRADGWARSPVIDLSGYDSAELDFAHFFEVEDANGAYDVMTLQVSSDGGTNWDELDSWDARDHTNNAYEPVSYDVTDWISNEFRVRYQFDSQDSFANDQLGWYIDDVEVTAEPGS